MINILVDDVNPKVKNLLIECLQAAGFDVVSIEHDVVSVQLPHEKFSTAENEKLNTQESIFPSVPRLRKVFEFIELNYHQNIKLEEVAQEVGYSSAYLTNLVGKLTGKTVKSWIIKRRITEASTLLLETNYSVEEIAVKVGYQNTNHFYRQFHNNYKSTPKSWKESQRCKEFPTKHKRKGKTV